MHAFDAHTTAVKLFGDSIAANMFMLGYAYQLGHVPIGSAAIEQAIELNGAAVEMSRNAFRFGRLAAREPGAIARLIGADTTTPAEAADAGEPRRLPRRAARRLPGRGAGRALPRARGAAWPRSSASRRPAAAGLAEAVARGYYKLLAYKDEYEVARLYASPAFEKALGEQFESRRKLEFHLAPPLLARRDKATGEPRKMRFGAWMLPVFRLLAKGKRLRGTAWDVFGYSAERKLERQMIADYERLLDEIAQRLTPADARHGRRARLAGARHQGLRPHQGAQLQGRQGARGGAARRAAQPLADRAQGGGVSVGRNQASSLQPSGELVEPRRGVCGRPST